MQLRLLDRGCRRALALLWLAGCWPLLGQCEPLLVIAPAGHAGARLALPELALIFKRKKLFWPGGRGRIQPANLPARDPARRQFSEAVLGARPEALESYWNEQYFQGIRPPHVLASGAAMLRFVAETRNAIGYVDACLPGIADAAVTVLGWIDATGAWHAPDDHMPGCSVQTRER